MNNQGKRKLFIFNFVRSISFYPAVISLLFIGIAIVMLHFERQGLSGYLHSKFESIIITHNETARSTLNSILTGMISLMVFSFTMVMVVLNQTGTNYSPRLIPGLITYRSNQIVLGFYLGTIIYSLLILINVESADLYKNVPGASILLDALFAIISLGLFVYFIHSISKSIQIGSIMEGVFKGTLKAIKDKINESKNNIKSEEPRVKEWFQIESLESGYIQDFDKQTLCSVAEKHNIILKLLVPPGSYINKGIPFIQMNKNNVSNGEICNEILKGFTFKQEEIIGINYLYGFKHLSEIAVKALSPGINDPGTAVRVLNYFTELFREEMHLPETEIIADKSGNPRIIINPQNLIEMFSAYLSPIRNYGKGDLTVTKEMLETVYNIGLLNKNENLSHTSEIQQFAESVIEDAIENITNLLDKKILNKRISKINQEQLFESQLKYIL